MSGARGEAKPKAEEAQGKTETDCVERAVLECKNGGGVSEPLARYRMLSPLLPESLH